MPKSKSTRGVSPQFQIVSLLMAKGDLTRDELLAEVSAERTPFQNALYNAKVAGRIIYVEKADRYRVTKDGKDWALGGNNLSNQRASSSPPPSANTAQPRKQRATTNAAVAPPTSASQAAAHTQASHSCAGFRCAVFSDGSFHLAKDGQQIDLSPFEHSEMLRYLERMAEQPGA